MQNGSGDEMTVGALSGSIGCRFASGESKARRWRSITRRTPLPAAGRRSWEYQPPDGMSAVSYEQLLQGELRLARVSSLRRFSNPAAICQKSYEEDLVF